MGRSAVASIVFGFKVDRLGEEAPPLELPELEDGTVDFAGVWRSLGFDEADLSPPDGRAGFGDEVDHFLWQVAEAAGLEKHQLSHSKSMRCVIGHCAAHDGESTAFDPKDIVVPDEAAATAMRLAEVLGCEPPRWHLVSFYG